jgi:hypothetical protein
MKRINLSAIFFTFGIFFLLASTPVFGQSANKSMTTGSWIGTIKIGEANPRLVFHIAADSSGKLTGTVDSPDKGVKGIPLSKVHVKGDSLVIEIAAAQAGYKGIFVNKKQIIKGTWQEGDTTYPLTLKAVTDTAEYSEPAKGNTSSLDFQSDSPHFDFYSDGSDQDVLADLAKTLESAYSRITDHMQTEFDKKIHVCIYPDLKAFHDAIFFPDAPEWVVGAASENELKIVSPSNPGSAHTYQSLMQAIVHELTHTIVLNVRDQNLAGLPKWLNEGYAFYEANQLTDTMRKSLKSTTKKGNLPSWEQLNEAGTVAFGEMGGYGFSASIIEFLVQTYGFEKLKEVILAPEKMESIYGISEKALEKEWIKYLQTG